MATSPPAGSRSTRSTRTPSTSRFSFQTAAALGLSDFLLENRNSPEAHKRGFEEAQRVHDRVLSEAVHVFELHRLAEETKRIAEEEQRRQDRARAEEEKIREARRVEEQRLKDEARLQALKAKPIPKPPPPVQEPDPAPTSTPALPTASESSSIKPSPPLQTTPSLGVTPPALSKPSPAAEVPPSVAKPLNPFAATSTASKSPFSALSATKSPSPSSPFQSKPPALSPAATNGIPAQSPQVNGLANTPKPATPQPIVPDRHMIIHQKLKAFRKFMQQQVANNPQLKKRMGDMRREIRKSIGQLRTGGLKENREPVVKIINVLRESLQIPSAPVDPNEFVLAPREPAEGAKHNEAQLPSLFLYLINILSKAMISQFASESGASPKTADAIGRVAAKVFSEDEFLWRGKPLIDMLVAKYRVVCPVLFGFKGNDKMEQGRLRVGWRKDEGGWMPEAQHLERMTGLGAGFAALTLRDFSKAKRINPWPPSAYWTALARIVNTPTELISKTQCVVLKAMISDFEENFIQLYGNAAIAALRYALVDFAARVPADIPTAQVLAVEAKTLSQNMGLKLV